MTTGCTALWIGLSITVTCCQLQLAIAHNPVLVEDNIANFEARGSPSSFATIIELLISYKDLFCSPQWVLATVVIPVCWDCTVFRQQR
jgi:hypothetical protein